MPNQPINEVMKTAASQASVEMTPDQIRAIRPPLPQVALFPPRFGYGEATAPNLQDCFGIGRDDMARYDFSGSQGTYSGTSIPGMGVW